MAIVVFSDESYSDSEGRRKKHKHEKSKKVSCTLLFESMLSAY